MKRNRNGETGMNIELNSMLTTATAVEASCNSSGRGHMLSADVNTGHSALRLATVSANETTTSAASPQLNKLQSRWQ